MTKRFGGTIAKRGTVIPGTSAMHAYQDVWCEYRPITYDGELTPEVCEAIEKAWKDYYTPKKPASGYGCLRWSSPDEFVRVDVERRAVVVYCTINFCD